MPGGRVRPWEVTIHVTGSFKVRVLAEDAEGAEQAADTLLSTWSQDSLAREAGDLEWGLGEATQADWDEDDFLREDNL